MVTAWFQGLNCEYHIFQTCSKTHAHTFSISHPIMQKDCFGMFWWCFGVVVVVVVVVAVVVVNQSSTFTSSTWHQAPAPHDHCDGNWATASRRCTSDKLMLPVIRQDEIIYLVCAFNIFMLYVLHGLEAADLFYMFIIWCVCCMRVLGLAKLKAILYTLFGSIWMMDYVGICPHPNLLKKLTSQL